MRLSTADFGVAKTVIAISLLILIATIFTRNSWILYDFSAFSIGFWNNDTSWIPVALTLTNGDSSNQLTYKTVDSPRVALAVQGNSTMMKKWLSAFANNQFSPLENYSDIFVLTYKDPLSDPRCISKNYVSCSDIPGRSTWTSGRNHLSRMIYKREQKAQIVYKYWIFFDDDIIKSSCNIFQQCKASDWSCCMLFFVRTLLSPSFQFPLVGGFNALISNCTHTPTKVRFCRILKIILIC